jgi:hypothetical protein
MYPMLPLTTVSGGMMEVKIKPILKTSKRLDCFEVFIF